MTAEEMADRVGAMVSEALVRYAEREGAAEQLEAWLRGDLVIMVSRAEVVFGRPPPGMVTDLGDLN